jgi:hypothetical protein
LVEQAEDLKIEGRRLSALHERLTDESRPEVLRWRDDDEDVLAVRAPKPDENGERWCSMREWGLVDHPTIGCRMELDKERGCILWTPTKEGMLRAKELKAALEAHWKRYGEISKEIGKDAVWEGVHEKARLIDDSEYYQFDSGEVFRAFVADVLKLAARVA